MSKYNQTILEIFGVNKVPGEIGIEVEMEGKNLYKGNIPPYWNYHHDGSLRGEDNAEFVLSKPLDRKEIPKSLTVLFDMLKAVGSKVRKDSPNTSVHVHLNMQSWSIKKVYSLICLWYIFEHVLLEYCGEDRIGNLFCLRGSDAELGLMRLASAVKYGRFNNLADQDGLRYTALNFTALAKFGSLEFRPLAGVYEQRYIETWIEILLELKDFSERFSDPSEVIMEFSRCLPEEFIRDAFPNHYRLLLTKDYKRQMHEGMRLSQIVAYSVNWQKEPQKKAPSEDDLEADRDIMRRDQIMVDLEFEEPRDRPRAVQRPRLDPLELGWRNVLRNPFHQPQAAPPPEPPLGRLEPPKQWYLHDGRAIWGIPGEPIDEQVDLNQQNNKINRLALKQLRGNR